MFSGLLNIIYLDYPGGKSDLHFIEDESWLPDSAVNELTIYKKGRWHIYLVMAYVIFPYRFICRFINTCSTKQKAAVYADSYLRTAQKDRRGSLKINYDDFNICSN